MRLEKIKLVGFKSFVDATTIAFPDQLMGVVGPNGCGKSNVIDAVRWVMGESSAKHLRGESLEDVIFNGSTTRKPVARAVVELVFDNSRGQLGGQYANYSQISLKRAAERDGQSQYYLNGTRCRRRDIMDVFLGTGLSPRSYAIIEQGMINRLIEAKPHELRIYLEEAAGISKYKERRRETALRMQHTQENLARVNDIIQELEKQLQRLKRQARTAERYKALKQTQRDLKGQQQILITQQLSASVTQQTQQLKQHQIQLEAVLAENETLETALIKQREAHHQWLEKQQAVQQTYYQLGNEISQLQQQIDHHRAREQALQQAWAQTGEQIDQVEAERAQDQAQLQQFTETVAELPDLEELQASEQQSEQALQAAEQTLQRCQHGFDELLTRLAEASKQVDVEKTRVTHLQQREQEVRQQLTQKAQASQAVRTQHEALSAQQQTWQQALSDAGHELTVAQKQLTEQQQQVQQQRRQNQQCHSALAALREDLQKKRGRLASLEALKEQALKTDSTTANWLAEQGLAEQPRLLEQLQVETGFECAVETVLGRQLNAVCVASLTPFYHTVQQLKRGGMTLLASPTSSEPSQTLPAQALSAKVSAPVAVDALLKGIYVAEDLESAMQQQATLKPGESVVTQDGIWLGQHFLRVDKREDQHAGAGALVREKALRQLHEAIQQVVEQVNVQDEALMTGEQQLQALEAALATTQQTVHQANQKLASARTTEQVGQDKLENLMARTEDLQQSIARLSQQQQELETSRQQSEQTLQQASEVLSEQTASRQTLQSERDQAKQVLLTIRQETDAHRHARHELALQIQQLTSNIQASQQALARSDRQLQSLNLQREQIVEAQQTSIAPIETLQTALEDKLANHVEQAQQLTELKQALSVCEQTLTDYEKTRKSLEQQIQTNRETIQQQQLKIQELTVRRSALEEQLVEEGYTLSTLIEIVTAPAYDGRDLADQLESVVTKLSRLGPINLAAIDELEQETERKTYLDSQAADLNEALETLEGAIRTIDQETRSRFRETFDKANQAFQHLFPRIFGGGKAALQLTDENLLEAGVLVMASPPGKRNSTIHLLSGGEKALTAIALVFSLFELNPAPFCMLDEVDAPLDDANVVRYSRMLQEMSQRVQLIYITHNKLTMEVASQLTGVTMHEAGVSRIVAVDMAQAVEMAEA